MTTIPSSAAKMPSFLPAPEPFRWLWSMRSEPRSCVETLELEDMEYGGSWIVSKRAVMLSVTDGKDESYTSAWAASVRMKLFYIGSARTLRVSVVFAGFSLRLTTRGRVDVPPEVFRGDFLLAR